MIDHDFEELENPETWADDEGFIHPPVVNPGAQLMIRLTIPELRQIESAAIARGLTVIDYIRKAAIESSDSLAAQDSSTALRRPA